MRTALTALALAAALLAAACGGSSAKPTATAATAAPHTATPTATVASSLTDAPTPTRTPLVPDFSHRLAVYTRQVSGASSPGARTPREVAVFDLTSGREVGSFQYADNALSDPGNVLLLGRSVVVATATRVSVYSLSGTELRAYFNSGDGHHVQDISVSPDNKLLALTISPSQEPSTAASVEVFDLATGAQPLNIPQTDARFAKYSGEFWQLSWRNDSSAVLISGATYTERNGPLAIVGLDGDVKLVPSVDAGYSNVSPTGRMVATGSGSLGCAFLIAGRQLELRSLDSGAVLFAAESSDEAYTPWEWAPDGSEFVYAVRTGADCAAIKQAQPQYFAVPAAGGSPRRVANLAALHQQWYGGLLFASDCPGSDAPAMDRWLNAEIPCPNNFGTIPLFVGNQTLGVATAPVPVGFVNP
jgi:hypothetical protein